MVIHSFITRPVAEHVAEEADLTADHFGAFVTGLFFDGWDVIHNIDEKVL
jgi:hypothetical protein